MTFAALTHAHLAEEGLLYDAESSMILLDKCILLSLMPESCVRIGPDIDILSQRASLSMLSTIVKDLCGQHDGHRRTPLQAISRRHCSSAKGRVGELQVEA